MPTFSMEDLENSLDRNDTVSIRYRSFRGRERNTTMGQSAKRSMDETKQLIKNSIFAANSPLKFREIARVIGRKPTPYLRHILNDMIDSGELIKLTDTAIAGNMDRFWYSLPEMQK